MIDDNFLKKYKVKSIISLKESTLPSKYIIKFLDGYQLDFRDGIHDHCECLEICENKIIEHDYLCKSKLRKKKITKILSKMK